MEETTTMQGAGTESQETAGETQQQTEESAQEKAGALQKLLDGLFGGRKEADAAESGKKEEAAAESNTAEKAFTQADLDAAIAAAKQQWEKDAAEAERMQKLSPEEKAAEEQRKKDAEISELKSRILQKELREQAVGALEKAGMSVRLADTLDYSSKERMEETLKSTMEVFGESLAAAVQSRLKGKTPEGLGGAASSENLIRDQIARNIRGL